MKTRTNPGGGASPLALFGMFFKIGALTWGGGYGMIPLIKREVVDRRALMSNDEFLDGLSIAQSLPGVLAVNTACYVGSSQRGLPGTLAACLGTVSPSVIIMVIVAAFFLRAQDITLVAGFFRGAVPAVTALIAYSVLDIGRSAVRNRIDIGIAVLLFCLVVVFRLHPLWVVVLGASIGLVRRRPPE